MQLFIRISLNLLLKKSTHVPYKDIEISLSQDLVLVKDIETTMHTWRLKCLVVIIIIIIILSSWLSWEGMKWTVLEHRAHCFLLMKH